MIISIVIKDLYYAFNFHAIIEGHFRVIERNFYCHHTIKGFIYKKVQYVSDKKETMLIKVHDDTSEKLGQLAAVFVLK